jgi:hypothetical protein
MSRPEGWVSPPAWSVPRDWVGERCFIICGGESIRQQRHLIPTLRGRVIAIKEGVLLRPDADVLFLGGEKTDQLALPLIPKFRGTHMVVRGKSDIELSPFPVKRVTRAKDHSRWCDLPTHVCGLDSGTSAMNLAINFGATELVVLGYDMIGGRWFTGEWPHPMPAIPESHFRRHMEPLKSLAADARAKGIRIVNCSPISRVKAFEKQPLEAFL